jgi:hypothetical protein
VGRTSDEGRREDEGDEEKGCDDEGRDGDKGYEDAMYISERQTISFSCSAQAMSGLASSPLPVISERLLI